MKRNQGAHTAWAEMLSKGRVKAHRCGVHLTHSLFVTLQTCQRCLRGSLISTALVWAVQTRQNGSHLTIGVPPMARFNMYYKALDFLYLVEKGREKKSSCFKAESSLIPDSVSVKIGLSKKNLIVLITLAGTL